MAVGNHECRPMGQVFNVRPELQAGLERVDDIS